MTDPRVEVYSAAAQEEVVTVCAIAIQHTPQRCQESYPEKEHDRTGTCMLEGKMIDLVDESEEVMRESEQQLLGIDQGCRRGNSGKRLSLACLPFHHNTTTYSHREAEQRAPTR